MVLQKANEFNRTDESKIVFNFNDIVAEAEALMAAARQQAEEMIAQAQREVDAIEQKTQEKGYREGFEQGMKEGEKKGYDQALGKGREEFAKMNEEAMTSLQAIINEFDQVKHDIIFRAEQDTVVLAVAIAKKVIKKASMLSEDITMENIKSALSFVAKPTNLLVKVNARDVDHLKTLTEKEADVFGRFQAIRFQADESIKPGGCVVVTQEGQVDGQLDVQVDRIVQEILIAK
jgi:flagellar assembly protein FliH